MELHSKSRLTYLATNIKLGWKWLAMKSTLAYYSTHFMFYSAGPSFFLYFKGASLKKESRTML